jgi:hypothetical protein
MSVPMAQLSFAFLCVISACSAVLHLRCAETDSQARNRIYQNHPKYQRLKIFDVFITRPRVEQQDLFMIANFFFF